MFNLLIPFSTVAIVFLFLVVSTRLYKRVCPSVRRSVGRSVGPSETHFLDEQKQRRRTTYAVCLPLLKAAMTMTMLQDGNCPTYYLCLSVYETVIQNFPLLAKQ